MKISIRVNPTGDLKKDLPAFAKWLAQNGYEAMDLVGPDKAGLDACKAAGLVPGSFDLPAVGGLITSDEAKRADAVKKLKEQISEGGRLGLKTAFICLVPAPENRAKTRKENFEIWKAVFPDIAAHAEAAGVRIAMEPWPGPGPHYPTLGCTPEVLRAMFAAVPSKALGLCYDPSHYVRMGIDYIRLLEEFGPRAYHVHLKDCEIMPEELYLQGYFGPALSGPAYKNSGGYWRYCIPGDGIVNWRSIIVRLAKFGYDGTLSVEPEDGAYTKTADSMRAGLQAAARYMKTVLR